MQQREVVFILQRYLLHWRSLQIRIHGKAVDEGFIKGLAEGLHVVPDRLSFDKG
jgi:hypothetical protein